MKRSILALLLALALSGAFAAGPDALVPKTARDLGLGGSFLSVSSGFDSLYGNPAGFAAEKGEFTILDLSTWLYVKPSYDNFEKAKAVASGEDTAAIAAANELLVDNGLGGGFSFGLGYVGKKLGLGFYAVSDEFASGDTALGSKLRSSSSINLVVGLGLPLMLGPFRLNIGGDARPFYRVDSAGEGWSLIDLIQGADLDDQAAVAGFGMAMDFGASLELGPSLKVGLALRDLSPSFLMDDFLVGEVLDALGSGSLPEQGAGADNVYLTPYASLGLAWSPELVPGFVEPSLYFELRDPAGALRDEASFWNLLHLGAELRLLNFASLRLGLNGGWPSAGLGLDLAIIELDAAVFTEELGLHPGDRPRTGVALQAALRF
ncbi:MAG TPA: hypothetical protein PLB91_14065 [Spirochaetales bacterium]|nr:hypothetical protein [Spirochaetales bacterium]HRY53892.1 hypothetical protein [Spirochaetia bacterium]HRZ66028.1 hypothetical protein [Spirochaetia bacterium]